MGSHVARKGEPRLRQSTRFSRAQTLGVECLAQFRYYWQVVGKTDEPLSGEEVMGFLDAHYPATSTFEI